MKKTIIILTAIISILLLLNACEDSNSANDEATILHRSTIQNQVGYTWFYVEVDKYEPNPEVIEQIKATFDPEIYSFLVFTQPACSCESKQLAFPQFMKVLFDSDIPDSNYIMYAMQSEKTEQPHEDIITISNLPEFYVLKDSLVIMNIRQAMSDFVTTHPDDSTSYEELILEAISQ